MACNCSKPITKSECARLREFNEDGRLFIYHIFDDRGLVVAYVPKGENPNDIAKERGFYNEKGELEWYLTTEHPCLWE
jgi:hypothetical protein|nr:MAG TPA: protein of unknown function (DUF3885) [Caudoviricetes sp.]